MDRTASYFVLIERTTDGYAARAPAFPNLEARAHSARLAYARLKLALKARLISCLGAAAPIPRDPVRQTRTLRVDLWYLGEQEDLR